MEFLRNFPFFSIILSMFCGIISTAFNSKIAKRICIAMICIEMFLAAGTLLFTINLGTYETFYMGHFPAPWGNEIRFGVLEAMLALFFCFITLMSVIGGLNRVKVDIEDNKMNLFYAVICLMLSSLLALIYTNDLFTGYVFIEINTIAAAGMIMIRQTGHGIVAAIRYLVMSSIGSGLFLIGISILYDITGQLLMVPAKEEVVAMIAAGNYEIPLIIVIGLVSVGLGIKSGLYPFHTWIPETYGYATPTASSILSSLVSKAYIILLIKMFYRVFGIEYVFASHEINVLYVFGVIAMIMGSVHAIFQKDCRKMIAYSSVAQIGYVYMGLGLGSTAGIVAAIFHVLTHAATKSLLFLSASGLYEVSEGKTDRYSLTGAGYRNKLAGIAFSVGSLSMVGVPLLSGFISKLLFATAAIDHHGYKMWITIFALVISTVLNAFYFLRMVVVLYSSAKETGEETEPVSGSKKTGVFQERISKASAAAALALVLLIALNFFLGLCSGVIVDYITAGLNMLG